MASNGTMKAWAQSIWGDATEHLKVVEVEKPSASGKDLLVKVEAVSTNPVDYKIQTAGFTDANPGDEIGKQLIVGFDASGVVEAVGDEVEGFAVGDQVYFAGNLGRSGSFAQFALVDYRIAANKPKSISHQDAAVLPLTAITAYEAFADVIGYSPDGGAAGKTLLIINGAGGVGSIAIQLAKHVFKFERIVATASRDETREWVKSLGATDVINHHGDMAAQLAEIGLGSGVDALFNCTEASRNFDALPALLAPLGHVVMITSPGTVNLGPFFAKRLNVGFEFMFARPLQNAEPEKQQALLKHVAELIDAGVIRAHVLDENHFDAAELPAVLARQAAGKSIGKLSVDFSKF